MVVNGISYAIPRNYFRYSAIGCGAEEQSFLVQAFLPDFSGAMAETLAEYRRGWGRTVNILLTDTRQTPDLEGFIGLLTHQNGNDPPRFPVMWDSTEVHGLQHGVYRITYGSGQSLGDNDVYVERKDNRIVTLIRCQRVVCTNVVFYSNSQLQINFERSHLADWQMVQDGVMALLDRFAQQGISLAANASAYSVETANCVPLRRPPGIHYMPPPPPL